ncbi:MAG: NAD-dependent epimerase/dehydratase family protein [Rickettsiales bacterium]
MSKKKILICGATGFIGRNMLEFFANKPDEYEVHATHFKRPSFDCDNVKWHNIDLRDPIKVHSLLEGVDIVVQAAATTSGSKDIVTKPYIHVTDNAVMNSYIFRSAFEHKVKHVIFFSCTVMYQSSSDPLKESDFDANNALHPRYFGVGNTKLYIEKMCEFYAGIGDTKYTAIRHSNIYGPHDKYDLEKSHFFGATVTKVMTAQDEIEVWGTGEEERDVLYVDDLLDFVEKTVKNQKQNYSLLNCGYGEAKPVIEIIKKIIAASGKQLKINHDLSKPTIKTSLSLSCDLAKKEIGWIRKTSLEEGIKKTISWWKGNIG